MPPLDERPLVRLRPVSTLVACLLLMAPAAAACRTTEVALVTLRNDTPSSILVLARLHGNDDFGTPYHLASHQEDVLIKYEENRRSARPIENMVEAVRIESPSCVASLVQRSRNERKGPRRLFALAPRSGERVGVRGRRFFRGLRPSPLPSPRCAGRGQTILSMLASTSRAVH